MASSERETDQHVDSGSYRLPGMLRWKDYVIAVAVIVDMNGDG